MSNKIKEILKLKRTKSSKLMGIIGAAIVLAIGVYCSFTLCSCESSTQVSGDLSDLTSTVSDFLTESEDESQTETSNSEESESAVSSSESDSDETTDSLTVYICGAVVDPGVYEFVSGSRIIDAVNKAGGFTTDAAEDYLNLAETLTDSAKIYVPTKQEVEDGLVSSNSDSGYATGNLNSSDNNSLININTAGLNELMTLPGIGEIKAQSILNYRNSNGSFDSIEDIKQVDGIKDGVYESIKSKICI